METPQMVTIKKNVIPDAQAVVNRKKYSDQIQHYLLSLVISESVIVEEKCDENGCPERGSYEQPEYKACRMNKDIIEVCASKIGWIPADKELNDVYAEALAEKALLEEKTHG